jgi:hypothetical protein
MPMPKTALGILNLMQIFHQKIRPHVPAAEDFPHLGQCHQVHRAAARPGPALALTLAGRAAQLMTRTIPRTIAHTLLCALFGPAVYLIRRHGELLPLFATLSFNRSGNVVMDRGGGFG